MAAETRVKSKNGSLFIVMNEGRRVGLGLIARGNGRPIRLGYFFPLAVLGDTNDIGSLSLTPSQAVLVRKFGDLEIRRGNWPVIGELPGFSKDAWPMPKFERYLEGYDGTEKRIITEYDEERLSEYIFELEASQLPKDYDLTFVVYGGLAGAFSLAAQLEDVLEARNGG